MKLVIDILEEDIKSIDKIKFLVGGKENRKLQVNIINAIRNSIPLPKGYGRLIDADAYRKKLRIEIPYLDYDGSLELYVEGIYSAIMSLDDAPTIIEADKEVNADETYS